MIHIGKTVAVPDTPFRRSIDIILLELVEKYVQNKLFFNISISHVDYRETKSPGNGTKRKPGYRYFYVEKAHGMRDK